MKLYQVYDKNFKNEKFCFNAKDVKEAKRRLNNWCNYHSHQSNWYSLNEVDKPRYKDNIHNDWVA